jgi:2-phospho-L-lactate guanylyltransferase (CobY/MobA/RfbA family)
VVEVPHIAFDVDSVEDLERFVAHSSDTQTYRVLQDIEAVKPLIQ